MITPEEMREKLIEALSQAIQNVPMVHTGGDARPPSMRIADAVLVAIEAQGLAIVPVEATEEMQDVAYDDVFDIYWGYMADGRKGGAGDVYSAMIEAGRI